MKTDKELNLEALEKAAGGDEPIAEHRIERVPDPDSPLPPKPELPEKVCPHCGKTDKIIRLKEYNVCCYCMTQFTD